MTAKATKPTRQRVPFGGHRRRLSIPDHLRESKTHEFYWFNDKEDRIQRALAAGWEFVTKKELEGRDVGDPDLHNQNSSIDSRVSKRVRDFEIFLMKIRKEFWDEDRKLKSEESDLVDEAIFGGGADRVEKSYGLDVRYKPNRR